MSSVRCRGVAANAANSLCVIAETLYYLSPDGVMAWDGSLPTKVSAALDTSGLTAVDWAMAGSMDMRYYLYLHQKAGGPQAGRLLVPDTKRPVARGKRCRHRDGIHRAAAVPVGRQRTVAADPDRESGTEEAGQETALQFEAVSGDIGLSVPDDKYISRVTVRLDALAHTVVTSSYDGGAFETLGTCAAGKDHQRINLPYRRADTLQLKDLWHRADGAAQCGLYAGGGDRWARERGTAEEIEKERRNGKFGGTGRHCAAFLQQ